ncbi:MAG TPA: phosphoribosylformylglycinamidine synthase I [Terriglobia bacterium]|nr:phosphoribosylformylglycinamidine synthase I [Terriglobia bacterium]
MSQPVTAILYAPGTNCHEETAAALTRVGLHSELVLLRDLLGGTSRLQTYQAAVIPGGFSYGDHLGAGRIFAAMMTARLGDELQEFLAAQKPLLGICNGFQVLAEAGILGGNAPGQRTMALLGNQSARFEDRRVRLQVSKAECLWTRGLAGRILVMPSAHGEGRAFFPSAPDENAVALRYCKEDGSPAEQYPENPNGSPDGIAGVTDKTGFVLGLMPHPERASLPVHGSQDGLQIFKNLASFLGG